MNTFIELAVSWVALDVLILVGWHLAHVLLRAPRTQSARRQSANTQPAHNQPAHTPLARTRAALTAPVPARAAGLRTPVGVA